MLRSVRRLTQRRGRDLTGKFLAEGRQAVREALRTPGLVDEVDVDHPTRHPDLPEGVTVPIWHAAEHQMRQLSDTVTPQGIVAVCRQLEYGWEVLDGARLVVICAQVRDPGNAGTVIRCADAFGADAVILTSGSVEIYNPKTVRSTVGSLFHLPILTGVPLADAVARVKRLGHEGAGGRWRGGPARPQGRLR